MTICVGQQDQPAQQPQFGIDLAGEPTAVIVAKPAFYWRSMPSTSLPGAVSMSMTFENFKNWVLTKCKNRVSVTIHLIATQN